MDREQFYALLKKYRQGDCTLEERRLIEDWYNSISGERDPFIDSKDEERLKKSSWTTVDRYITRSSGSGAYKKQIFSRSRLIIGIAASILLCITCFIWLGTLRSSGGLAHSGDDAVSQKVVTNAGTKPLRFTLPDGSRITLSPESSLRYSTSPAELKREVFLEGEAFFDVAHDPTKPFLVYTNDLTTEVLGTRFFVKAYKEQEVVVTVTSGKVSVYQNADEHKPDKAGRIVLTPNQQAIYNPAATVTVKKLVGAPEVIAPKPTLKDRYTNASVNDILKSLINDYGIDIVYDSVLLSNCTLTADMSDEGFYEQIGILCNALGADYKVSESAVIIKATGCKH